MTGLLFLLGVVIFAVGLVVSVSLHECGHMVPGKLFGVKVTQFFVGFGKTVWSRKRGETEYGVKALPLGGYVKLVGMLPPEPDRPESQLRGTTTGMFTQLVSDARSAEWELVEPEDRDRVFYRLVWWKKVIVMAGGPTMNLLIAFALFWGLFASFGNARDVVEEPVVSSVSPCVVPYDEAGRECTATDPVAPAYAAGLKPGDKLLAFNGTAVTDWDQLTKLIRANADGQAAIEFERDGETMTATTNTLVAARPREATSDSGSGSGELVQVGFLGVAPTESFVKGGPIYTLDEMGRMTGESVKALVQMPVKVWHVGLAIVGVEKRDPEGPVSIVGGGRFAGETVAEDSLSVGEKTAFVVALLAGFNLFIGLLNFVPLLPLDGGHIAGALYEGVRRGLARLRGRPDPGFVDVAKAIPFAYAGGFLLLVMGVVLIVGDLVVPVQLS